jgi:hypothetical protein
VGYFNSRGCTASPKMRLIHTKSLELSEFFGEDNTPDWAILSHVWEAEEISYSEWNEIQEQPESQRADFLRQKKGYAKIREFCSLCQEGIPLCHHLDCRASATCRIPETICCGNVVPKCQCEPLVVEWCWVDTCCIDKSSSAELSEAINSMFKWYEQSIVCIAYLSDVPEYGVAGELSAFRNSTWFTRGWTLQELIAPAFHGVNFYSMDWKFLGSTTFTPENMDMPWDNNHLSSQTLDLEPSRQPESKENQNEPGGNGDELESGTSEDQIQPKPSVNQDRIESNENQTQVTSGRRKIYQWSKFLGRLRSSQDRSQVKSQGPSARNSGDSMALSGNSKGETNSASSNLRTITKPGLPPGWEARHTPTGRKYFVDHTTKTTSWVNPYKPYEMSRQQLWLCEIISQITKIPKEAIGPFQIRRHLHSYSIAERMSWASSRKTTRGEDIAYCLLGLFDLNMPLIYGEGSRKAFFRLQEEMLKYSYDHTLFLWQNPIARTSNGRLPEVGLFADHPARFQGSSIYRKRRITAHLPIHIQQMIAGMASRRSIFSNNAIHMSVPNISSTRELHVNCPAGCRILILNCMVDEAPDYTVCIHLCRSETDGIWYRSPGTDMPTYLKAQPFEKILISLRKSIRPDFGEIQVRGTW